MSIVPKISLRRITAIVVATLGFIGTIISLYAFFVQEKKVDIQYEIIANTNVLDINADVSRLDITYNGISLKEKNEHLRIINLRIINRGTENILKEYFDDNDPFGFRISEGKIIEKPEVIETSSNYLKRNLIVQIDSTDRVNFSKVIIEPKESFVLKLLVLHKSGVSPSIIPTGKIAGMKEISVFNAFESKNETPFFAQVFYGSIYVQLVRSIAYFLVLLALIIVIGFSVVGFSEAKDKHNRKKNVEEFKNLKTYNYSKMDDALFERYIESGSGQLEEMNNLMTTEKELTLSYHKSINRIKNKEVNEINDTEVIDENGRLFYRMSKDDWYTISIMLEDGLIIKEKERIVFNQPMKNTLINFIGFITEKRKSKTTKVSIQKISAG